MAAAVDRPAATAEPVAKAMDGLRTEEREATVQQHQSAFSTIEYLIVKMRDWPGRIYIMETYAGSPACRR